MKAVWICLAILGVAQAQTFDVATVKLTPPGTREFRLSAQHGSLIGRNITLAQYIAFAYDLLPSQVTGAPSWAAQDTFDIAAKAAPETPDAQMRRMLQMLLAERFGLRAHLESKEMAVYALTVSKSGPKLHVSKAASPEWRFGRGKIHGDGASVPDLAAVLAGRVARPVVDQTGIAGSYDFDLAWTPDAPAVNPDEAIPDPNGASIFSAVQEQLGLRLEGRRAPVDIVVVDRVDRPTLEN